MSEDRRRPPQYAAQRDDALGRWVSDVVYPYSDVLRRTLDRAGGRRGIRKAADLRKLPITPIAALGDGRAHVLEPTGDTVAVHGPLGDRVRLALADVVGRREQHSRRDVDPAHKPIVWTAVGGSLFVASSTTDLDRLTALGRRGLAISGVRSDDRILVLDAAGTGISPWQFLLGARDAGVATLHLDRHDDADLIAAAAPTVLAGRARSLVRVLGAGVPDSVRRLVVNDGRRVKPAEVEALTECGLPVAEWWVADGARAAWVRCPGGEGFHTWPTHEVVEIVDSGGSPTDDGRLVWSAVGWHGSVWFRVDTGHTASVVDGSCPTCGRTTPRVVPSAPGTRRRVAIGR